MCTILKLELSVCYLFVWIAYWQKYNVLTVQYKLLDQNYSP